MVLDEILKMWSEDSDIDRDGDMAEESIKSARLHAKYLTLHSQSRLKLGALQIKRSELTSKLSAYYKGYLNNPEDLEEMKRPPNPTVLARELIKPAVDADPDMIKLTTRIVYQQELVDVLKEIVSAVNKRGYVVKNTIDWIRFTNGG